jgi:3-oxoacyl-[acyl-carrier protein] reductase
MLLSGKVAIVTGGGRGIGACISRTLAKHGAAVAIVYHQGAEAAASVAREITEAGGAAEAYACDIRDASAVQQMVAAVLQRSGRIDGLINNAIAGRQCVAFEDAEWQDYADMLDYGCRAVVNTIHAVRPVMREQGGGRVVNTVTELWNMGSGLWSTYLAGKGAMVGLSRALANELGPDGITVNMVAPGWMVTDKVDPESEGSKAFGESLPLRRHGSADEIGNGCVFFLSDLASYVTGAYLPVTGGRITQMGA